MMFRDIIGEQALVRGDVQTTHCAPHDDSLHPGLVKPGDLHQAVDDCAMFLLPFGDTVIRYRTISFTFIALDSGRMA